MSATNSERFLGLDGLRGLLAISVVLHHFALISGTSIFGWAWVSVDIFFILSGFVLSGAYSRDIDRGLSFADFMAMRLMRLMPAYWMGAILGCIAFVLINGTAKISINTSSVLQTLLLLPSFEVRPTFEIYLAEHLFPANPPSWSLFFELWVGLAFWAWARQARPFQGAAFFMLLFGTLYVIALFLHGPVLGWSKNTLAWGFARVGVFFFVGVIFWLYRDKLPKVDWKTYLVILSTYVFLFSIRSRAAGFLLLATSPILVMLTIGLPRPDLPWVRLLLTYLGRISFPIYIVHYPLLEIAKYLLGETHIRSAFGVGSYFLAAIFFSEILIRLDSRLSPMRVAFSKARIIK